MRIYAAQGGRRGSVHQPGISVVVLIKDAVLIVILFKSIRSMLKKNGKLRFPTCALPGQVFSLSSPMMYLAKDPNQAGKSPVRAFL